ncbi:hypothetical protein SuNHUV7_40820 (plasmid) [Pseudoseohaeicola sp. NH-UV-7]
MQSKVGLGASVGGLVPYAFMVAATTGLVEPVAGLVGVVAVSYQRSPNFLNMHVNPCRSSAKYISVGKGLSYFNQRTCLLREVSLAERDVNLKPPGRCFG